MTLFFDGKMIAPKEARGYLRIETSLSVTMRKEINKLSKDKTVDYNIDNAEEFIGIVKDNIRKKLRLTDDEVDALNNYQGGGYVDLNAALRNGNLQGQDTLIELGINVRSALKKLPKTEAQVYRNITFGSAEEYNQFLSQFDTEQGPPRFTSPQFDSTTQGGRADLVVKRFDVHIFIKPKQLYGADIASVIRTFPDRELEILFPPGVVYIVEPDNFGVSSDLSPIDENATKAMIILYLSVSTDTAEDLWDRDLVN